MFSSLSRSESPRLLLHFPQHKPENVLNQNPPHEKHLYRPTCQLQNGWLFSYQLSHDWIKKTCPVYLTIRSKFEPADQPATCRNARVIPRLRNRARLKQSFPFKVGMSLCFYLGLDARKPVFGGLRTTKAQTSLRIRAV